MGVNRYVLSHECNRAIFSPLLIIIATKNQEYVGKFPCRTTQYINYLHFSLVILMANSWSCDCISFAINKLSAFGSNSLSVMSTVITAFEQINKKGYRAFYKQHTFSCLDRYDAVSHILKKPKNESDICTFWQKNGTIIIRNFFGKNMTLRTHFKVALD